MRKKTNGRLFIRCKRGSEKKRERKMSHCVFTSSCSCTSPVDTVDKTTTSVKSGFAGILLPYKQVVMVVLMDTLKVHAKLPNNRAEWK